MIQRHISISGELGSGKSTLAQRIAQDHDRRLVSIGKILRELAEGKKMTIGEAQSIVDNDASVDAGIDDIAKKLGESSEPMVFDGRLAWNMVPSSFKVHLVVDPVVASVRLHTGRFSPEEGYTSPDEAAAAAEERYRREQRRFLSQYGVNTLRLRNYDLVIDSTYAKPDEVVAAVENSIRPEGVPGLQLKLSPRRIQFGPKLPTEALRAAAREHELIAAASLAAVSLEGTDELPLVIYARPYFVAVSGHDQISAAEANGETLLDVGLIAESGEKIGGRNAEDYVEQYVSS